MHIISRCGRFFRLATSVFLSFFYNLFTQNSLRLFTGCDKMNTMTNCVLEGIIMATVLKNIAVSDDFYLLKASGKFDGKMGQFCMLRAWDEYPVLSRPISIFDCDDE